MKKLREWMHGKGRKIVITVMLIVAAWIIADYYQNNRIAAPQRQKAPASLSQPQETRAGGGYSGFIEWKCL